MMVRPAPGNAGKRPSLEFLHGQRISLIVVDLSAEKNGGRSYLAELALPGARLQTPNLSGANLEQANLRLRTKRRSRAINQSLGCPGYP